MRITDKCHKYTTPELRLLGMYTIDVCRKVIGHGNKPAPKFKIDNTMEDKYGTYYYEHIIVVNPSIMRNISQFVGVIIHEYTHHIQRGLKRNYTSSVNKYGYENCPFEIEANENTKKYKKKVWKKVRLLMS
jgi:hypothetical protein